MAVRQTVVSDTNSPKTLTFNKLRGVDYSSSPFEVNTSRATSMKNMINEDGVNHKRNGWTEDTEINKMISEMNITNIKGIFFSNDKNKEMKYMIATNSKIYAFMKVGGIYSYEIEENDSEYTVKFLISKKDVFVFYPNTIYSFNLDSKKFKDSSKGNTYIPTTTISINPVSEETSARQTLEYANLLNKERKNTMIGKKESEFNILYFTIDYSSVTSEFSNISKQTIYLKQNDMGGSFTPSIGLEIPKSTSSFPLRSIDDEITIGVEFIYSSIFPSTTSKMCCKVFDENNNMLYKTYSAVMDEFMNIKISETKTLRIVYEMEAI